MIRIVVAVVLAALVITDAAVVPDATDPTEAIERPRGRKGDRLPIGTPDARCTDAVRGDGERECVGGRMPPPGPTPPIHLVRLAAVALAPSLGSVCGTVVS